MSNPWITFLKEFSKTYVGDNKDRFAAASVAYKAQNGRSSASVGLPRATYPASMGPNRLNGPVSGAPRASRPVTRAPRKARAASAAGAAGMLPRAKYSGDQLPRQPRDVQSRQFADAWAKDDMDEDSWWDSIEKERLDSVDARAKHPYVISKARATQAGGYWW